MAEVHPTAIVAPEAELHESVRVGPFCVISGPVKIGARCRLIGNVYLKGPLTLGEANVVYPFACLGFAPQDRKFDADTDGPGTVIGGDNLFREGVTVHRATKDHPTTIGSRNYFMGNSHVGHDVTIASDCVFANGSLVGGHAVIADRVFLGGNGAVAQFTRVGRLAMISGSEGVTLDVPPFCMVHHTRQVSALNLVGLRRAGLREHIAALKEAFQLLYRQHHVTSRAVELISERLGHDRLCMELVDFVRTSTRGVTNYGSYKQRAPMED